MSMSEEKHPRYLYSYDSDRRRKKRRKIALRRLLALSLFCVFVIVTVFAVKAIAYRNQPHTVLTESTTTTEPVLEMSVAPVASTTPAAFHLATDIFRGTIELPSYSRPEPISFDTGKKYTNLQGIITFRGNNYRDGGSYGTVKVINEELKMLWQVTTGSVERSEIGGGGVWTGSGWTGQPLIVKWPEETKQKMNLYLAKKADPDLVEVIYPCLDGKIYFLDLKDGSATRPAIKTGGGAIKGTASLYPNGIPLLFVGPGDALPASKPEGVVKYRIYSLVDQTLLYTFGTNDPVAYRKLWQAYDSSALIDAETDTLIEPGENGVLYTVKLNTKWDPATGSLSIKPDEPIKFRYTAPDYAEVGTDSEDNTPSTRWWGMEDSAVAWRGYLYVSDNGGKLMCIDLNTMKAVWVQDVLDDTNCSPIFEESIEDGTAYIYISTSLHITATGDPISGKIPIWKINAATGEKVWTSQSYPCVSRPAAKGGVQGTGLIGRGDISNVVVFPVASTPSTAPGLLVALDKSTGQEVWRFAMANYAWSSPVAVYTEEGKSYIVICDSAGMVFLLEGASGNVVASLNTSAIGSVIEATPAVYGNTIVVGTRGKRIDAIEIK
jgi:outer membrane protein assembly factor BamB